MYAVSETPIETEGERSLDVAIGCHHVKTRFLVTPNIEEPVLGLDWLSDNVVIWSFYKQEIVIAGHKLSLLAKPGGRIAVDWS